MPKSIKIADDIYEYVQSKAIPFEDDFNSALRRLLNLKGGRGGKRSMRQQAYKGGLSITDLEPLVLKILVQLGGTGSKGEVEDVIESMGLLSDEDYQLDSNQRELWRSRLTHSRTKLIQKDELLPNSPKGRWEISPRGRARVEREGNSY